MCYLSRKEIHRSLCINKLVGRSGARLVALGALRKERQWVGSGESLLGVSSNCITF